MFRQTLAAHVLFVILIAAFFAKALFTDFSFFPGDLLTRAYYPWMSYSSGPVHNPLISDVWSQIYTWKKLAIDQIKSGQIPVWNQWTLSGTPLLANLHSGALYPGNLLLFWDFVTGWDWLLSLQMLIGCVGVYWWLRSNCLAPLPSGIAAVQFAWSGFGLVYLQLVHAGHALAWLPWIILLFDRFAKTRRFKYLASVPVLVFALISAGHFQIMIWGLGLSLAYGIYRCGFKSIIYLALGGLLSAMILVPGLEMAGLSVRGQEQSLAQENYGLLPLSGLVRLVAPDWFGHPVTRNYWGSLNYQETVVYAGLLGYLSVWLSFWQWRKLSGVDKFWLATAGVVLLLGTDTVIGRLPYSLHLPGISTSSAGRVLGMLVLPCAWLTARVLSLRRVSRSALALALFMLAVTWLVGIFHPFFLKNSLISLKNSLWPLAFLFVVSLTVYFRSRPALLLLLVLMVIDGFRFGWKYNPIASNWLIFPVSPEISYISTDPGIFRVEHAPGPILPSNTWEWYGLRAASGYDPMTYRPYAESFQTFINGQDHATGSRYTETSKFSAAALAAYGTKYLITKNNSPGLDQNWVNPVVFPDLTIWQNRLFTGLVPEAGMSDLIYANGRIDFSYTGPAQHLVVKETAYPGWRLQINGHPARLSSSSRQQLVIAAPAGSSQIKLRYYPDSLLLGTTISWMVWWWCIYFLSRPASFR